MSIIAERVKSGAARMGLELDDTAAQRFARYYDLLVEGNQKMNLTAVLEPEEAVDRHFLDSIAPSCRKALRWWMWVPERDFPVCRCSLPGRIFS